MNRVKTGMEPRRFIMRIRARQGSCHKCSRASERSRSRAILRQLLGQLEFRTERGLSVSLTAIFAPEDKDMVRPYALFATRKGGRTRVAQALVA
jgi:hypothetical protein